MKVKGSRTVCNGVNKGCRKPKTRFCPLPTEETYHTTTKINRHSSRFNTALSN